MREDNVTNSVKMLSEEIPDDLILVRSSTPWRPATHLRDVQQIAEQAKAQI